MQGVSRAKSGMGMWEGGGRADRAQDGSTRDGGPVVADYIVKDEVLHQTKKLNST